MVLSPNCTFKSCAKKIICTFKSGAKKKKRQNYLLLPKPGNSDVFVLGWGSGISIKKLLREV